MPLGAKPWILFSQRSWCFISEKLYKIILDRWRSLYKFLSFILAWYSNRFRWNAPRGFTKPLFPFHQRSFPSRSRGSLVYNDQTIRPVSKPAKEINSNRTSFVSLIRCSNLSSSVPRCPRGQFFSFSPPSSTIFQRLFSNASLGSPIPLLHPSLHQLPLCSRAPAISYRNLSCAPKHFSENRLARAVAGQSPKCWRSRSSPGEDRSTISPTYPARYVCTYICYICDWKLSSLPYKLNVRVP